MDLAGSSKLNEIPNGISLISRLGYIKRIYSYFRRHLTLEWERVINDAMNVEGLYTIIFYSKEQHNIFRVKIINLIVETTEL